MKRITELKVCLILSVFILVLSIQSVKANSVYMGEWASDYRIEVNVHSFNTSHSIAYHPYTPDITDYVFAWVDVSVRNIGTAPISVNRLDGHLQDSDNYIYTRSLVSSPKLFQTMELAPGETIRGELYFEVPAEAIISEFIWQDYHSDIHIIIPEFPTLLVLPLIVIITSIMLIIWRRNKLLP